MYFEVDFVKKMQEELYMHIK